MPIRSRELLFERENPSASTKELQHSSARILTEQLAGTQRSLKLNESELMSITEKTALAHTKSNILMRETSVKVSQSLHDSSARALAVSLNIGDNEQSKTESDV